MRQVATADQLQREIAMRKVLCILLTLVAAPAWAEWVHLEANETGNFYIDPVTIRKDGNMRRVWGLLDLKQRGKDGEMSRRYLKEYDCKGDRDRLLSASMHSELMGGGTVLLSWNGAYEWDHIPPGTVAATILKLACKK